MGLFSFAKEEITMPQCLVFTRGRSVTAFLAPPRIQRTGQGPRSPHPKAGPDLSVRWKRMVRYAARTLYQRGINTLYVLNRSLDGPPSWSGRDEELKKSLSLAGTRTTTLSLIVVGQTVFSKLCCLRTTGFCRL
jgi:hypothetical protein